MNRLRILLAFAAAATGAGLSTVLFVHAYDPASAFADMVCGGGASSGCEAVRTSDFSHVFGIPLAAFGVAFYAIVAFMLTLSLASGTKFGSSIAKIAFRFSALGLVIDMALLAVQAFGIGEFCTACLLTYVASVGMMAALWPYRKHPGITLADLKHVPEARIMSAAGIFALALITISLYAGSRALTPTAISDIEARYAENAYEEFRSSPEQHIDVSETPMTGSPSAPIKVVLFSDFLCPWCRQLANMISQFFPHWEPNVAVYYKNYPLDPGCNPHETTNTHPGACWAAVGGVCAQSNGLFWEYHDRLYSIPRKKITDREVVAIAKEIGIDSTHMKQCMAASPMRTQVMTNIRQAKELMVQSTPTIFVNGRRVPKTSQFGVILTREAERLGIPPLRGLKGD